MAHIVGTPGNDTLNGTIDGDLIEGLAGDDTMWGDVDPAFPLGGGGTTSCMAERAMT
jgi:hypothetical protein